MKKQTIIALAVIGVLLVATIGVTFAYFASSSQNDNAGINAETEELGSILLDGTKVFTSYDLLPGQMGVQEFTIEKNSDTGNGIYEIDLEATVPEVFRSDIEILLYKTTDPVSNNVTVNVADPTLEDEMIYQEDSLNVIGTPELIYQGTLTENPQIILEQADFDVTTLEKTTYYLVYHYKNNGNQDDQQGKTFTGTITVRLINEKMSDYEKCIAEYGEDSIQCSIIADASDEESEPCPTVNEDGTVTVISAESINSYICSAPDDYGTSYYYRGNVDNNYVKFAGFYWRILRVNGDGSIRMIYDGTSPHANYESSTDRQIGASAYNSSSGDNAYVGYMYGTIEASTYEETHANINNSTIKTKVDTWYEENILGTEYEQYISDTLFCNDRSFGKRNSGTGTGDSDTQYRWYSPSNGIRLTCTQQNDRFTVNDEVIGNGSLTYPIGLLTKDEGYLAGGYNTSNYGYYLYTGNIYWTMSPYRFNGSYAGVSNVNSTGSVNNYGNVSYPYGVRPVINLKSNSLKSGDGTALNPYTVEEDI